MHSRKLKISSIIDETTPVDFDISMEDKEIQIDAKVSDLKTSTVALFKPGRKLGYITVMLGDNDCPEFSIYASRHFGTNVRGIGTCLIYLAHKILTEEYKSVGLQCDANASAIGFYFKIGMTIDNEKYAVFPPRFTSRVIEMCKQIEETGKTNIHIVNSFLKLYDNKKLFAQMPKYVKDFPAFEGEVTKALLSSLNSSRLD